SWQLWLAPCAVNAVQCLMWAYCALTGGTALSRSDKSQRLPDMPSKGRRASRGWERLCWQATMQVLGHPGDSVQALLECPNAFFMRTCSASRDVFCVVVVRLWGCRPLFRIKKFPG